jgi:hypothetical protein
MEIAMSQGLENEGKLYRAAIRAMPGNPARRFVGDSSGLHRVLIYKRRGVYVSNEDLVEIAASDLTFDEALKLSTKLNREFNAD